MEMRDEALVALAQAGDEAAGEALYSRFKAMVRSIARPYFLIGADREDLIQEGMIGLYKAVRGYTPERGTGFYSFAQLCVRRQILTAVQASNRQKHIPLNAYVSINGPAYGGEAPEGSPLEQRLASLRTVDPESELLLREESAGLEAFVSKSLTGFERDVLSRFLEGKSYREIAGELGRSAKAVDNALQRIKHKAAASLRGVD